MTNLQRHEVKDVLGSDGNQRSPEPMRVLANEALYVKQVEAADAITRLRRHDFRGELLQ